MHKVLLYADDLSLHTSNPKESIPKLIHTITIWINQLAKFTDYSGFPFKLEQQAFNYLGINVTGSYKDLYDRSFKVLSEHTKQDFLKWSALPITLVGRVNTIKITARPWFKLFLILLTKS